MADVWILYQKVEYEDGSDRQFVASVYRNRQLAQEGLDRREEPRHVSLRRRRRDGKPIKNISWELTNWMVH